MNKQKFMLKTHFRVILYILLLGVSPDLLATSANYYFKILSVEDGLSSSKVKSICIDHKGYMWIATDWGLNRYDKDQMIQFESNPEMPNQLPSDGIYFITKDKANNLWIGTANGLVRYIYEDETFQKVIVNKKSLQVMSSLEVEKGIIFGGIGELYYYSFNDMKVETLPMEGLKTIYNGFINLIRYDSQTILINTRWHGLYSYNLQTHAIEKLTNIQAKNISSIYVDTSGLLWISDYGKGLSCYENYRLKHQFTTQNSDLNYDVILDIIEKDNALWIATDGGGINILSLDKLEFKKPLINSGDYSSFPSKSVFCLYKDTYNNVWAGTIREGLIGLRSVSAKSYRGVPFMNPYGLSHHTINCFYQESEHTIWIGTDGGGVNKYDTQSELFEHYPALINDKIVSIAAYSEEYLLLSSFNNGLILFNKRKGTTSTFELFNDTSQKSFVEGYSIFLSQIDENHILLSGEQLFILDTRTNEVNVIASKGSEYLRNSPQIKKINKYNSAILDKYSVLMFNAKSNTILPIYQGNNEIIDASIDSKFNIWLATREGLFKFDATTKTSIKISTDLFTGVKSVVCDKNDNIWIGTNSNLLFLYLPQTNQFSIFDEADGVIKNEYLFGANLCASNGDIYVGGTSGLTRIEANIPFLKKSQGELILEEVFLDNNPIAHSSKDFKIKVPSTFSNLKFRVTVSLEDIFTKQLFKYRVYRNNQLISESNSLTHSYQFNNATQGIYQIDATYIMANGEWGHYAHIATIEVLPPWWKTWWFYTLSTIVILALLIIYITWFKRVQIAKRIEEVESLKNTIYEEKIRFLINMSHELRTPLTLMYSPLKRVLSGQYDSTEYMDIFKSIFSQTSQMKDTIDLVLKLKRVEDGKEVLSLSNHNFNNFIKECTNQFLLEFADKNITILFELDNQIGINTFDKAKCLYVVQNFLINALKFSEENTTVTIRTIYIKASKIVRLEVQDEGKGLDNIDTEQLFERYYQGNHDKPGSGIGLAYAKSLIDLHQGIIGAINNTKGATFYFEIPYKKASSETLNNSIEITQPTSEYEDLKKYTILVVEDVANMKKHITDLLSQYFDKVYTASDGKEGLIVANQYYPDIILSDIMMPRMNGFELCSSIKNNKNLAHIPVILLTAFSDELNLSKGYSQGADLILFKPFDDQVLLSSISNQLNLRKQIKDFYHNSNHLILEENLNNADEAFIKSFDNIVTKHLSNTELDVPLIINELGVSRSLLFNRIKQLTNKGIVEYINDKRIEKAKHLLETTSESIQEISLKVGFNSARYFSRVFKKANNLSPQEYRTKLRN